VVHGQHRTQQQFLRRTEYGNARSKSEALYKLALILENDVKVKEQQLRWQGAEYQWQMHGNTAYHDIN